MPSTYDRFLEDTEPVLGNYFVSTYPPFSCWNEGDVEHYRDRLVDSSRKTEDPFGLYVHIPFCLQRCQFCYYLSYENKTVQVDRYIDALLQELTLYAVTPALANRNISVVYFGGGTPSLLSSSQIRTLMDGLQRVVPWNEAHEVTFECAPRSITKRKLEALHERGVTRLSLGVQQLNDDVLRLSGRVHLVQDVERAYEKIRRVGFDVVNLDLIVGLPGETDETFYSSLKRVIELEPDSVTIYQLEIPLNTPLSRAVREGRMEPTPASWNVKRDRLRRGFDHLQEAGYTVSSAYTAVRDPSRHRFHYQEDQYHGVDLLGIGASAFSYLDGTNQQNQASLTKYLTCLEVEKKLPFGRAYVLSDSERLVREFVLQLKLGEVQRAYFLDKFGVDIFRQFAEPTETFVDKGWLLKSDQGISVTPQGLLRVDRILSAFYLPEHRGVRYS